MAHRAIQRSKKPMAKDATNLPSVPAAPVARKKRERKEFADNRAKSVHIGQARTTRALAAIGTLRVLGNRKSYDLTDDNRAKILAALEAAVKDVRDAFMSEGPVTGPKFALD